MKGRNLKNQSIFVILAFVLFAGLLGGCKKDETSDNGYWIKFKVDGNQVEYTLQSSLVAAFAQAGTQYNAVITGSDSKSNVGLQVYDSKAIAANKYSGYTISNGAVVGVLMHYADGNGTVYNQSVTNSNLEITVSELNTTTVRGTFNGTLKASGKSDISITEGKFYVWRAN